MIHLSRGAGLQKKCGIAIYIPPVTIMAGKDIRRCSRTEKLRRTRPEKHLRTGVTGKKLTKPPHSRRRLDILKNYIRSEGLRSNQKTAPGRIRGSSHRSRKKSEKTLRLLSLGQAPEFFVRIKIRLRYYHVHTALGTLLIRRINAFREDKRPADGKGNSKNGRQPHHIVPSCSHSAGDGAHKSEYGQIAEPYP